MRQQKKKRRRLSTETLEIRRCLTASLGWDGPGQGSAELSYYVAPVPASVGLSQAAVEAAVESALAAWSDVIDVEFTETNIPNQRNSLDFEFTRIDGAGSTLAQAYLPDDINPARIAGDVEFDISENWELGNSEGRSAFDFTRVAVHEIGHAIGIDHLDISGTIMAPFVSPNQTFNGLTAADIDAALEIYAPAPTETTPPTSEGDAGTSQAPTVPEDTTSDEDAGDTASDTDLNEPDNTADTDNSDNNRFWRPWRRFWFRFHSWFRFGSRLMSSPAAHNSVMPGDVNQDSVVTARDALTIINQLVREGQTDNTNMMLDANNDGNVSAGDALFVINEVGRVASGGEAASISNGFSNTIVSEGITPTEDYTIPSETDEDEVMVDDGGVEADDLDETVVEIPNEDDDPATNVTTDDTPIADEDGSPANDEMDDDEMEMDNSDSNEDDTHCPDGMNHQDRNLVRLAERMFETLDTNEDGQLMSDEISAVLFDALQPIDTNEDGGISLEEINEFLPESESKFDRLDDNGDGSLTIDEVDESLWERLLSADANEDSAITEEELDSYRDSLPPRRFRRLDENEDGLLNETEIGMMKWQFLVAADADENGEITVEEFNDADLGQRGRSRGHRFARIGFHRFL